MISRFKIATTVVWALVLELGISACSTPDPPPQVVPFGPDTFTLSISERTAAAAREQAVSQANEFCNGIGTMMMPDRETATKQSDVYSFSFTFLCLENGDPRLRTPRMRPTSDGSLEPEEG